MLEPIRTNQPPGHNAAQIWHCTNLAWQQLCHPFLSNRFGLVRRVQLLSQI